MFECDFFGIKPIPFDPRTVFNGGKRPPFDESLAEAVRLQRSFAPWNPRKPSSVPARRLFLAVRPNLPPEIRDELMLCCAYRTNLDTFHKVDGFFILEGDPDVPVTFDLSFNRRRSKEEAPWGANGIITMHDVWHNRRLSRIGRIIARHLANIRKKGWRMARKRLW
jgi:hypothetical protein